MSIGVAVAGPEDVGGADEPVEPSEVVVVTAVEPGVTFFEVFVAPELPHAAITKIPMLSALAAARRRRPITRPS